MPLGLSHRADGTQSLFGKVQSSISLVRGLLCQLSCLLGNAPRYVSFEVTGDVVNVIMNNWMGFLGNKKKNLKMEVFFF